MTLNLMSDFGTFCPVQDIMNFSQCQESTEVQFPALVLKYETHLVSQV